MKIKNIAFFGVMASIFGIAGAEAANSTPTKIATTAYATNVATAARTGAAADVKSNLESSTAVYDINAKTVKVNGTDVLTSHQTITTGTTAGTIKVGSTDVAVKDLKTVATTGSYTDLTNKPTLGTAAAKAASNTYSATSEDVMTGKAVASAITNMEKTTNKKNVSTIAAWDSAVSASSAGTDYPSVTSVATALTKKQDVINSSNKLAATNVQDDASHRFVSDTEKSTWNSALQSAAIANMEKTTNKVTSGLLTVDSTTKQITAVDSGSDTAYASTSAISSDLTKVKDALSKKAASATTLSGYGITNAYTKTEVNSAIANMEVTTNKKNVNTTAAWDSAVSASSAGTDYPTVTSVATALTKKQDVINSSNKLASSLVSGLGTAAGKAATDSYVSTGTDVVTGKAVAAALGTLNSEVNAGSNKVVTGVVETNGKISSVNATLIKNANVAAAGTANIEYGKMDAALNDINGTTGWSAASDCSSTTPCVLTYIGSNTYRWTVMDIPAAN